MNGKGIDEAFKAVQEGKADTVVVLENDPNLVLVVLGDHQPATIVSGQGASHDVPISIISKDPAVFGLIAGWRWQDGLVPTPDAPVWPMSAFRDRFLDAFSAG